MDSSYQKSILPDGLRIVTEYVPHVRSVCMGVWVEVGSRDETSQTNGISHLIEHMLFKGTARRDARQIAESLEAVGGSLNGFTGREKTCFQARILDEHLPLAVDILSDLLLQPRLDPQDLEMEKSVVADEIRDLKDSPSEYIDERFAATIWRDNALGFPISGTEKTVARFTAKSLRAYMSSYYQPKNLVVAAAGNLSHQKLVEEVEKRFRFSISSPVPAERDSSFRSSGQMKILPTSIQQLHLCLGGLAYPYKHSRKYALLILNTILGDGMSSRLFQSVREKKGLAYAVYSYIALMSDTGLFNIYLATDPGKSREALAAALKELDLLREQGLRKSELKHAQAQLKGRLMLGLESMNARMSRLAHQEILLGTSVSLDETERQIDAVSGEEVQEVAEDLYQRPRLSLVAIGPVEKKLFRREDLWG